MILGYFPGNKSWKSLIEGIEPPFRFEKREHGRAIKGVNRPKMGHFQGVSTLVGESQIKDTTSGSLSRSVFVQVSVTPEKGTGTD